MQFRISAFFRFAFHPTHLAVKPVRQPFVEMCAFRKERFSTNYADFVKANLNGFLFDFFGKRNHFEEVGSSSSSKQERGECILPTATATATATESEVQLKPKLKLSRVKRSGWAAEIASVFVA